MGHKSLSMTRVYARIADRTVADEYFAVSEKVEALYDAPRRLPADAEGTEMAKLRREMHRRMLGNGIAHAPWRWTATSSRSASPARSSSPRLSSGPPSNVSGTTRRPRGRSPASRSSMDCSADWTEKHPELLHTLTMQLGQCGGQGRRWITPTEVSSIGEA